MKAALAALLARPLAHRGLHDRGAGIIENSLAAAEAAVAAGFGIECDIQLAGDGEAVVFHDDTLDRLTGETGRVDARPSGALAALPLRGSNQPAIIPRLTDYLARLDARAPLVVELKSHFNHDPRLADRAVEALTAYRGVFGLKSFDPSLMARCRDLGATCPLGLIGSSKTDVQQYKALDFDFLSWHVDDLANLRKFCSEIAVMTWTIRTRAAESYAHHYGAQIVFEDFVPKNL